MTPAELRERRAALGMSQAKLAAALGITESRYQSWEVGRNDIPPFLHLALDALQNRRRGPRGEANAHHKLTARDVLAIRGDPRRVEDIAHAYGVTSEAIRQILRGVTWSHLPAAPRPATKRPRKTRTPKARASGSVLTRAQAQAILDARASRTRHTAAELAQRYGVSRQTIQNIWTGAQWKHLQPSADAEQSPFMRPPRLPLIEED